MNQLIKSINNLYKTSKHQKDYYKYYKFLDTKYYLTNNSLLKEFIKKEKNRKDYCRRIRKEFIPKKYTDIDEYLEEKVKLYQAKQRQNYLKMWKKNWLKKGIVVEESFYERYKTIRKCELCNLSFSKSSKVCNSRTIRICNDRCVVVCKKCMNS